MWNWTVRSLNCMFLFANTHTERINASWSELGEGNGCTMDVGGPTWLVKDLAQGAGLQHFASALWNQDFSISKTSASINFPLLQSSRKKINHIRNINGATMGLLFHLCISNKPPDILCVSNKASPLVSGRDYSHKREPLCQNNGNKKVFKIKMSGR